MTNRKWFGNEETDLIDEVFRRLGGLSAAVENLERKLDNQHSIRPLTRVDPETYLNPYEGQRAIDPSDEQHMWYSNGQWRKAGGLAVHEIKVFEDIVPVTTGDTKFDFEIAEDLHNAELVKVEAFLSTPGGSTTQVQLRKLV